MNNFRHLLSIKSRGTQGYQSILKGVIAKRTKQKCLIKYVAYNNWYGRKSLLKARL